MELDELMPIEHKRRILWFLKKQKNPIPRALIGRRCKINYYDLLVLLKELEKEGLIEKARTGNREYYIIKKNKKR